MQKTIEVIIYSNQKNAINTINHALEDSDFNITGISASHQQILTLLVHYAPEFLIIYLKDWCKATNQLISRFKLVSPRTRIIVLQKDCSSANVFTTIKAGADIFLSDEMDLLDLTCILSTIMNEDIYMPEFVAASLLETIDNEHQTCNKFPLILTDKEKSILKSLADGMDLSTVAEQLEISSEVAKAFMNNILQKIHFTDIAGKYYHEIISDYQLLY